MGNRFARGSAVAVAWSVVLGPLLLGAPAITSAAAVTSATARAETMPGLAEATEGAGTAGTLNSVIAAPDGRIFGGDDRGVFRLESGGWRLIRPVDWVTPTIARQDPLAAQFSGWPGALVVLPGTGTTDYQVIASDGAGADIIRSTDRGATWTRVPVVPPTVTRYNGGAVTGLCWAPESDDSGSYGGMLFGLVQKDQDDTNPAYVVSSDRGVTWTWASSSWPQSCDMGKGSLYAAIDPLTPRRSLAAGGTSVVLYDGDVVIEEEVDACLDDPMGFARGAISGIRAVLVTEDGCYARSSYDPLSQTFGEWTESEMSGVGSVGIFSQGYYEIPTTMTMYGGTAYLTSQAGVFAYSWDQDRWFNAGRGVPLRSRVAVPSTRVDDRVVLGGYQGSATVLGLFSSANAGKAFQRMTGVPARVEPRGLALTSADGMYLADYDVLMGSFEVWRSTNAGATWVMVTSASQVGEPIAMIADGGSVIVVVKDDGGLLSLWRSNDSGATFVAVDDAACGWSSGSPRTPTLSLIPGGGIVALHTVASRTGAIRGCTLASGSMAAQAIVTSAASGAGTVSLIDYLDGRLRAYLGPNGSTNAMSLVSTDGRTWTSCTTDAAVLGRQPSYISSIARDADRSLIGTVVNPIDGTRLVRSTDGGCTWTGADDVPIDEDVLDTSSMVLPEDGEAQFSGVDDSLLRAGLVARKAPGVTATVRSARIIGVGSSGSRVVKVRFGMAPAAPSAGRAVVGKGEVTLSFQRPATVGAGLVGYSATCTAAKKPTRTATAGATATSVVVKSLAKGVSYTCTVSARDAAGPGAVATWTGIRAT